MKGDNRRLRRSEEHRKLEGEKLAKDIMTHQVKGYSFFTKETLDNFLVKFGKRRIYQILNNRSLLSRNGFRKQRRRSELGL